MAERNYNAVLTKAEDGTVENLIVELNVYQVSYKSKDDDKTYSFNVAAYDEDEARAIAEHIEPDVEKKYEQIDEVNIDATAVAKLWDGAKGIAIENK